MKCLLTVAQSSPLSTASGEVCGAVRPPFPQRIAESEREFQILRNRHQSARWTKRRYRPSSKGW